MGPLMLVDQNQSAPKYTKLACFIQGKAFLVRA